MLMNFTPYKCRTMLNNYYTLFTLTSLFNLMTRHFSNVASAPRYPLLKFLLEWFIIVTAWPLDDAFRIFHENHSGRNNSIVILRRWFLLAIRLQHIILCFSLTSATYLMSRLHTQLIINFIILGTKGSSWRHHTEFSFLLNFVTAAKAEK